MYVLRKEGDYFCFPGPSGGISWRGLRASWRRLGRFEAPLEPPETAGACLQGGSGRPCCLDG
eukprot:2345988-Pyramimonas_sp.AAC.1